jgi:hypothetical protein
MTSDADCSCGDCSTGDLPVNPFEALRVSYGMLLGADDFRALIGNPRGKQMVHSAWLHGSGVVWGFDVRRDGEVTLTVSPGLAVDGLGRELASETSACLDLRDWLAAHDEPGNRECAERRTVHACLVVEFGCSLGRPVPTLADTCDVTRKHDDFSRVVETATVALRPGRCAARELPYHRVRVLLGLDDVRIDDPVGAEGEAARRDVAQAPVEERAGLLLHQFRRLAALDSAQLRPATEPGAADPTYFPVLEPGAVALAGVELDVLDADGCTTIEDVRSDMARRTVLLPTGTIEELVCGLAPGLLGDVAVPDAGGPRVLGDDVRWSPDERLCHLPVSAPLNPGSLRRAVRITSLSRRGWVDEDIEAVRYDRDAPALVVELADRPVNPLIRVVVRGTGSTPVYGDDPSVPLAGLWGSSTPGTVDDGHDAVVTFANPLSENGDRP